MLPESKNSFPKLLCLDQNKWIDLARAHYDRPAGADYREALASVRQGIKNEKLIVPVAAVNMFEINSDIRSDRRQRLSQFMVELSRNHTVLPFMPVRSWEIRNAVYAHFGRPEPCAIRRSLIRRGLSNALGMRISVTGIPPEIESEILECTNSTEESVSYLTDRGEERASVEEMRRDEVAAIATQEKVRQRYATELAADKEWRRFAELYTYLTQGAEGVALVEALQEVGISMQSFFESFVARSDFECFFARVHTLEVTLSLILARDRDQVRSIQQNDSRDIAWLCVAVPYSNVIVLEKYWHHVLHSTRLDQRYGVSLLTDARDLPEHLHRLGCL
jgi:hypothetical protein